MNINVKNVQRREALNVSFIGNILSYKMNQAISYQLSMFHVTCRDIDLALLKFLTFTLNHSLKIVNYVIQDDTDRQLVTDNH